MKLFWGMSQEELVKGADGVLNPEISKRDTLIYHSEILGEKALTAYIFASDKLIRAKHMLSKYFPPDAQQLLYPSITPQRPIIGECILDFEKFEEAITAKHGKPYLITHHDTPDRTDQNIMGSIIEEDAIRRGQISWFLEWNTRDTLIILSLRTEAEEMRFEIGFTCADLDDQDWETNADVDPH